MGCESLFALGASTRSDARLKSFRISAMGLLMPLIWCQTCYARPDLPEVSLVGHFSIAGQGRIPCGPSAPLNSDDRPGRPAMWMAEPCSTPNNLTGLEAKAISETGNGAGSSAKHITKKRTESTPSSGRQAGRQLDPSSLEFSRRLNDDIPEVGWTIGLVNRDVGPSTPYRK